MTPALQAFIRLLAEIVVDELLAEQRDGADSSEKLEMSEPAWPEKES